MRKSVVYPEKIQKFLQHAKKDVVKNDFKFVTGKYGDIKIGGISCNGYFCDKKGELAFWTDPNDLSWLPIAVHEYGHFLQWKVKRNFWMENTRFPGRKEKDDVLDLWLNGEEFAQKDIDKFIGQALNIEHDNEINTIKLIKRFNLEDFINVDEYVKKANAYVLFYHMVKKYRKFYPYGHEPYNVKEIWNKMPNTFFEKSDMITDDLMKTLDDYYKPLLGEQT